MKIDEEKVWEVIELLQQKAAPSPLLLSSTIAAVNANSPMVDKRLQHLVDDTLENRNELTSEDKQFLRSALKPDVDRSRIQLRMNKEDELNYQTITEHLRRTLPSSVIVNQAVVMREALRLAAEKIKNGD